jgi:type IV pilus assembly protein PilM
MLSKPKTTIGIDLGTHSVKAVQLSNSGDRLKVEQAALLRLQGDGMSEEKRNEEIVRALRSFASSFQVKRSTVITALPGQDTFIRYLRFPKMPPDELRNSIELEADQNLPYDLTEVSTDSVVLEEITERNETIMKILLVAAKNEMIDKTLSLLRSVGISPNILGITTLAIADAFEANGGFQPDETVALINIGASSTNIHFCRNGISNFTRDISRGGRDLTIAIQKLLKVPYDEAERLKADYAKNHPVDDGGLEGLGGVEEIAPEEFSLEDPASEELADEPTEPMSKMKTDDASRIVNATRPAVNRLIGEIRRSIDYYEKQLYEKNVSRLVLSGGTATFPGLDQLLADATGVPVEIVDPVQALLIEERSPDVKDLINNRAQFNVAVGLAARGFVES